MFASLLFRRILANRPVPLESSLRLRVHNEVGSAFDTEQELMKEGQGKVHALIPLDLDGYLFDGPWESSKASQVKDRLAADFTGWESDNDKYRRGLKQLLNELRSESADHKAEPSTKL